MKRYVLGTLVGGASLFLLGYLIYVVLLPNPAFANGSAAAIANRAAPNLPPIIAAELLFGFLLTRALTKSGAIGNAVSAAKTGALIGGLVALAYSLLILGTTEVITAQGVLYEAVTWAVRWGIAGAVVSLLVGKQKA
jgi:hypothetical protein